MVFNHQKHDIMKKLPRLELSYENILHKKVSADMYAVIPKGRKVMLWFTYFNNKNTCYVLHLNQKLQVQNIIPYTACFDSKLSYGTILYGTLFKHKEITCFTCEDICYYKGKNINNMNYGKKLNYLTNLFNNEIKQLIYTKNMLLIGLPIIKSSYNEAYKESQSLSYNTYAIKLYNRMKSNCMGYIIIKTNRKEATFKIKATIKDDIYELFYTDEKNVEKYYDIAMIPDYKTSVMMNKLFRSIKENTNLDLLEESDDEEEFENISEDKFVDLNKSFNMLCEYNYNFKKWHPVKVYSDNVKIATMRELKIYNH